MSEWFGVVGAIGLILVGVVLYYPARESVRRKGASSSSARGVDTAKTMLNKVPEVTIYFWIIKILCTTVGETAADFLNFDLGLGLSVTTTVVSVFLAVALAAQFRLYRYVPGVYVLAGAFLLSIGGAYFLARAALRPVDAVVSSAREMTESDLGRRLPVSNPNDEIGRLATTMNGFLARLEAAFARREEALARQRRFAADASHELRAPLTAISGHARMLDQWTLEDPTRARQSIGVIRRETGRMRNLVESLLTLTRGDEGAPLDVGHYDLAAVAEDAAQLARASMDGGPLIEYLSPEKEIEATFDRERVLRLAGILLDNAVKHTPEDGRIEVSVGEENGWATLEVSNTGTGIDEDQVPLIFERFHRADPSRADGGAGLGLSIARQIAESHGGAIRVRSKPGQGSTFKLLIPKS